MICKQNHPTQSRLICLTTCIMYDLTMQPVASILADAGIDVVTATAREISYISGGRQVTSIIKRYDRLPSRPPASPTGKRLLLAARSAGAAARAQATAADVDLVIDEPREIVLSGHTYVKATLNPRPRRSPYLQSAVERILCLAHGPLEQLAIADGLGTSQQTVSAILKRKSLDASRPSPTPIRAALVDNALKNYTPAPPEETYWYGLATPRDQASAAINCARDLEVAAFASGEIAADELEPWRVPVRSLIYTTELIDLTDARLVRSDAANATLIQRVSDDPTVIATAQWWLDCRGPSTIPTVDPVIALIDLAAAPDPDDGAVERFREWIIAGAS